MSPRRPEREGESESLLARWSQRKRRALDSTEVSVGKGVDLPSRPVPVPPSADEKTPAPAPGDNDMPPLDSLGPESDYSGFLSPGVSEELRRVALRKLFHSPLFNVTDGLDDYDDDFTSFAILHEAFHAKRDRRAASAADREKTPEPDSRIERTAEPDSVEAGEAPAVQAPEAADFEETEPDSPRLGESEEAENALSARSSTSIAPTARDLPAPDGAADSSREYGPRNPDARSRTAAMVISGEPTLGEECSATDASALSAGDLDTPSAAGSDDVRETAEAPPAGDPASDAEEGCRDA